MLPAVRSDQDWQAVVWDEQVVRPAAKDLATRLGLGGETLSREAPARGRAPGGLAQPGRTLPEIAAAPARTPAGAVAYRGDPRAFSSPPRLMDADRAAGLRVRADRR